MKHALALLLLLAGQETPATVSFKLNGKDARVKADGKKDNSVHSGSLNVKNDSLTLAIYGADPAAPVRSMLAISVENFQPATAKFSTPSATFSGYVDPAVNKVLDFRCNKNAFNLTIDKCEKGADGPFGATYLVSGTFSGDFDVASYQEKDTQLKKIAVTDGKFSGLLVESIGKKR